MMDMASAKLTDGMIWRNIIWIEELFMGTQAAHPSTRSDESRYQTKRKLFYISYFQKKVFFSIKMLDLTIPYLLILL